MFLVAIGKNCLKASFRDISKIIVPSCSFSNKYDPPPAVPVITVPKYVENRVKREKAKQEQKRLEKIRLKSREGDKSVPIITCRKPELNHYLHQTYPKYEEIPLASKGWNNKKAKGDHFTIHPYGKNPALLDQDSFVDAETDENEENKQLTFSEFNVNERILDGLEAMGIKYPTVIQSKAIPHIIEGSNVLCSAETGSGKTLAYLIPLFDMIMKSRTEEAHCRSPKALVIVPSRELAEQISDVARKIGVYCGIAVSTLATGFRAQTKSDVHNHIDISVGTVGALTKAVIRGAYKLSRVQHVVIDEADTMMDDSFCDDLAFFLQRLVFQSSSRQGAQLILVGATFPKYVPEVLEDITDIDSFVEVQTENLHRLLPHVKQKFLRMNKSDRPGKLLELVKSEVQKKKTIMIFSNTAPTCDWISLFLNENNVPAVNFHSGVPDDMRIEKFMKFKNGEVNAISCTDLGSRGLDTIRVEHVLNYEFPLFMSDYIHRAGRTGRVGSKENCCVTNFVIAQNTMLVQKIEMAARRVQVLPSVDANIKRKLFEREMREQEKALKLIG